MGLWEQKVENKGEEQQVENKGESDQEVVDAEVVLSLTQHYSFSYKNYILI